MRDLEAHLEKQRTDAADCALIRDLATEIQASGTYSRGWQST